MENDNKPRLVSSSFSLFTKLKKKATKQPSFEIEKERSEEKVEEVEEEKVGEKEIKLNNENGNGVVNSRWSIGDSERENEEEKEKEKGVEKNKDNEDRKLVEKEEENKIEFEEKEKEKEIEISKEDEEKEIGKEKRKRPGLRLRFGVIGNEIESEEGSTSCESESERKVGMKTIQKEDFELSNEIRDRRNLEKLKLEQFQQSFEEKMTERFEKPKQRFKFSIKEMLQRDLFGEEFAEEDDVKRTRLSNFFSIFSELEQVIYLLTYLFIYFCFLN